LTYSARKYFDNIAMLLYFLQYRFFFCFWSFKTTPESIVDDVSLFYAA